MSFDIKFVECNNDNGIEPLFPIIKKHFDFERDMIQERGGRIHRFLENFEDSKDYYFSLDHFVATSPAGDIVGILSFDPTGEDTFISVMYVEEEFRRKGLGKALLEKLKEKRGKKENYSLGVDVNNESGIAFYKSCGFISTLLTMNCNAPVINTVREVTAITFGVPYPNTGNVYVFNKAVKENLCHILNQMIKEGHVGIVTPFQRIARENNSITWPNIGELLSYRFIDEDTPEPKLLVTFDFTDEAIDKIDDPNYDISIFSFGFIDINGGTKLFSIERLRYIDLTIVAKNQETEREINNLSSKHYIDNFFRDLTNAWNSCRSTSIVFNSKEKVDEEVRSKDFFFSSIEPEQIGRIKIEIGNFLILETAILLKLSSCYTRDGFMVSVDYAEFKLDH